MKRRLLVTSAPRLQMMLILLATGAAGFFVSYALLHLGVGWMWIRYPIAILLAYCVFLLLLRLWVAYQHSRSLDEDIIDYADAAFDAVDAGSEREFSIGDRGAGSSWNESSTVSSSSSSAEENSASGGFDLGFDLDDGWLIVAVVLIIAACLVASLYIVYIAPALLAEILVDSLLVAGLYRKLRKVEKRYWLEAAVRKTLLPVLLTAALFTAAGWMMQRIVPEAQSIGEVWRYIVED